MLLHGGERPNVEKDSEALNSQNGFGHLAKPGWQQGPGNLRNYHEKNPWNLEGRAMFALSRFGENARMASEPTWLHRVQHQQALVEPPRNCSFLTNCLVEIIIIFLWNKILLTFCYIVIIVSVAERPTLFTILAERGLCGSLFMLGEVMFITRPLIYVLLIRKYGIRSWFPWCISLAVDLAGVGILSHVTMLWQSTEGRQLHLSELEKNEVRDPQTFCIVNILMHLSL